MTSPNSAFTDVAVTSLQSYSGVLADNVLKHNALLRQLEKKGNIDTATGRSILQEISFDANGTVGWYSGSEAFSTAASEVLTSAEFPWKQLVGVVTINGLEQVQNSGREAVHSLLKARMNNLKSTMRNTVAEAIYADGTGSSGKEFGGLQLLVAGTPTNTVGGISGSSYSWWKNHVYDFSARSVTSSSTTIQHAMNTMMTGDNVSIAAGYSGGVVRGTDRPDMIVGDGTYYNYYLESLTTQQRFTDDKGAGAGFVSLMFQSNIPVIFDTMAPASTMRFINTDYLFLKRATGRWFSPLGDRASINQDALVIPVVLAGNLTVSSRARQGVIQE